MQHQLRQVEVQQHLRQGEVQQHLEGFVINFNSIRREEQVLLQLKYFRVKEDYELVQGQQLASFGVKEVGQDREHELVVNLELHEA